MTVRDTLFNADGTKASGRVEISWKAFTSPDGKTVAGGKISKTIIDGVLDVALVPNAGASPSGTSYVAAYFLSNGISYQEYWVVPAGGPVTVAAIRASPPPTPSTLIALGQLPVGGANQVLGTNAAATSPEHKTLAVGTAGTDFAIAHSAGLVTFNLPDASATARGAVTTGAQTFAGNKTLTGNTLVKNLNGVLFVDQYSGADAGAKIAACIADLPSTGGVCDARGLTGPQSIGSPLSLNKNGVTLLLSPAASYNVSGTITISNKGVAILGGGPQFLGEIAGTTLKWTGSSGGGPIIKVNDSSNYFRAENLSLDCNALASYCLQLEVLSGSATKRPILRNIEYRGYRVSGLLVGGTLFNLDSGQIEGALFESQTFRGGGVAKTWNITATGASRSANVVTITTTAAHGLLANDPVVIVGVTDTSFSGNFNVASVPSSTTFTYSQTAANATSGNGTANLQVSAIIQNAQNVEASTWLNTYIDPCGTCSGPSYFNHYYHIYNRTGGMNMLTLTSTRADSFAIYAYDAVSVRNWRTEDRYLVTTPFTLHSQPMTLEDVDNRGGYASAVDAIEWNINGNVIGPGTATGAGLAIKNAHLLGNVAIGDTSSGDKRYVSLDNVRFENSSPNSAGLVLRNTGGTREQYISWQDAVGSREFIHGQTLASLVLETNSGGGVSTANLKWDGTALSFDRTPTFSTMTAGSVLFAGTAGILSQNNSNFFWDNGNVRLGLGTGAPAYPLDLAGTGPRQRITNIGAAGNASGLTLSGKEGGATERGFSITYYDNPTDFSSLSGRGIHFVLGVDGGRFVWGKSTGTERLGLDGGFTAYWQISSAGHFQAPTDNTYDIGASGANRPRNAYVAGFADVGTGYRIAGAATAGRFLRGNSTNFVQSGGAAGGAGSCAANNWVTAANDDAAPTCAQPAASNLSNGTTGSGAVLLATSPTITTPTISGALGSNLDLGAAGRAVLTEIANETVTGTTANLLAKLTGAPSTAIKAATSDTSGIIGIVVAGAGTSGNAQIAVAGRASCTFDGATTAGNYVQISSTTAGDCKDGGSTYPATGQVIGRVLSTNGASGTYDVEVFPTEHSRDGTVTSVALSMPGQFTVTGSPVTTSGTLTASWNTQSANLIFGGPSSGGAAAPTFRVLVKADQVSTTVYTDQANTYTTGAQDFGSATSLKIPGSAGAAPTASGLVAYDSTANVFKGGVNGATQTFAMLGLAETFTATQTVSFSDTGTADLYGLRSQMTSANASGTRSLAAALESKMTQSAAGTLTTEAGIVVRTNVRSAGTVTENYGVKIEPQLGVSATVTRNTNLWSGTDRSSFSTLAQSYLDNGASVFSLLDTGTGTKGVAAEAVASEGSSAGAPTGFYGFAESRHTTGTMSSVTAVEGDAYHTAAGTTTAVVGVASYAEMRGTGGTVTNLAGFRAFGNFLSAGTVTNNYGLKIDAQSVAATSNFGIDIGAITSGTTNWAIRTNSGLVEFGGGTVKIVEGTPASGVSGSDLISANSTTHWLEMNPNNYGAVPFVGTFFSATATATASNTTAETSILGTGSGTKTLGANLLSAGRTVRVTIRGYLSTDVNPVTLRIKVKLGSTVVLDTLVNGLNANLTNMGFELSGIITCRTTGASGTVMAQGNFIHNQTAQQDARWQMLNTAATTIDTTASQTVDATATWGTAAANNTISGAIATIEVM